VAAIQAPQEIFIASPGAGHSVSVTSGDGFLDTVVKYVRLIARSLEPASHEAMR
jgi:hypothetical protein